VKADEPGSTLTLRDLWVDDTAPWERPAVLGTRVGRGLDAIGADVTLERAIVERSRELGMFLSDGTATVADVVVRDGLGDAANGTGGFAIAVVGDQTVGASDLSLARARDTALFAASGGRFTGMRVRITDTRAAECAATTCTDHPGGVGASAILGGAIDLTDFTVSGAALCGVQVAGGALDLRTGRVDHCAIGANVQDASYDFARLSDGVVYADNERNLDSASLPVPMPSSPIAVTDTPP